MHEPSLGGGVRSGAGPVPHPGLVHSETPVSAVKQMLHDDYSWNRIHLQREREFADQCGGA
jgi:hypothetical protein